MTDWLYSGMDSESEYDELWHYGTPRHSGRYPWGSGENPYQHSSYFMSEVNRMRKEGMSETEIAEVMDMSTTELRAKVTQSNEQIRNERRRQARQMREKGYSFDKIAESLGVSEGTARNLLKDTTTRSGKKSNAEVALELKDLCDAKGLIDVGAGVEREIGISEVALTAALDTLKSDGYEVIAPIRVEQMTNPGNFTTIRVLAPAGTTKDYIYNHLDDIQSYQSYDQYAKMAEEKHPNFERTKYGLYYPQSLDSKRVMINYADDDGEQAKDGVIELRRGVDDISLGKANYAQVRIMVDDKYYMKGMAIYRDDMPEGVDVIFNTNKEKGTPPDEVFKKLKKDPKTGDIDRNNPFGAAIKSEEKGGQRFYTGPDGKEHLSVINIVNAQGDWGKWSRTISPQMLSKQRHELVKKQLDLTYQGKMEEYRDICAITNPVIKMNLLKSFADDCDASAVHLKATAFPGQTQSVILPVTTLKDDEIYAPNYDTGDTVCLVRYPHEGTFEIPVLRVNNNNRGAKSLLKGATDAVGISLKAAEQLSGADFDGDTVTVIPVSRGKNGTNIKADPVPPGLQGFHTSDYEIKDKNSTLYNVGPDTGFHKQTEMGKVSNLITDMTIKGASMDEIVRATKHAMVVIDAEKHHLDWRQSAIDNGISELKIKYQGGSNKGASTLISRSSSEADVPKRKPLYSLKDENGNQIVKNGIVLETGEKAWKLTGEAYHKPKYAKETVRDENGDIVYKTTKSGKKIPKKDYVLEYNEKTGKYQKKIIGYSDNLTYRTSKTTKMAAASDARELLSAAPTPVELEYANYANKMKALGNTARKEMMSTEPLKYSKSAKAVYSEEVAELNRKLDEALRNAPRERMAQVSANVIYNMKVKDNPLMTDDEKKKIRSQALAEQRVRYGAKKSRIDITDREWEAIQAGAISGNKLSDILNNTDADALRARAMPKNYTTTLTPAKEAHIRAMEARGYNQKEIADQVGLSVSTINKFLEGNL